MTSHKHVFIGGLHRSGTTLLADLLAQHPQVSGLSDTGVIEDEGQLLQSVYPVDMTLGGPGRFAFTADAHLTDASPLVTPESRERLLQAWRPYWDLTKPVLLEKTPGNLMHGRFLQALFPNSYFIFITRHPIANAIATYKWSGTGIYSLLHHWLIAHQRMAEDLAKLERVRVVAYEHLMQRPQVLLEELAAFIGLPEHRFALTVDPTVNEKYFRQWRELFLTTEDRARPVPSTRSFYAPRRRRLRDVNVKREFKRWIKRRVFGDQRQLSFTLFEAQDAAAMFEPDIRRFGYSLLDLERLPAWPGDAVSVSAAG